MGNRGSYPKNLAALIKIGAMGLAYPTVCLYQSEQEGTQEPPIDLPPSSTYDETPAEVTVEELSTGKETWLSHTPQKLTVLGFTDEDLTNQSKAN